jgi:hypothetical protein
MKAPPPNTFVGLAGSPAGTTLGTGADAGIKALANEVGATSAFDTAPTLTQYGAGAPVSTPLTSATPFNPAAPMANPTYAQPSGLQGLQTNLSGSLGSNLTPSVTNAVTSAGTDATSQQALRQGLFEQANPNGFSNANFQPVNSLSRGADSLAGNGLGNTPTGNVGVDRFANTTNEVLKDPYSNVPSDVTYGAGQSRITTNPADLVNQTASTSGGNILQSAWSDFTKMPLKDKLLTGIMANTAYQMANPPKAYEKPKYKSTWNGSAYTGYRPVQPTPYTPQYAHGGLADLGGYSDYARGGRMLKGPGDGMSDNIPATIAGKQPARLANEEFVIPADVVSHLGNGSSEAGAKQLYKMMDRVRQARTGHKKQGKQIKPEKYLA